MQSRDIIVVGLQPWDIEIGSNCKNIALQMAMQNRVLYVNRALDRISSFRNRRDAKVQERKKSIRGEIPDLLQERDRLWVLNPRTILESVNWMPSALFRYFNKINNSRLAKEILNAAERLGFIKPILLIDNDFFRSYHLPDMLKVDSSIYYIRDFLSDQPYFRKHGSYMEQELMSKVDLVVANSPYLAEYGARFNTHSYYVGQGCDFSLFEDDGQFSPPEDLLNLPKPIIGYVGALVGSRLDIRLLEEVASARPEWNFVFVGPEDAAFGQSKLHLMPNVYFMGRKDQVELPAYIKYFDVCLNPQLVNQLTVGNYPRKVDEYLAMGKPVVATSTPFMEMFKDHVYLCANGQEYLLAIENAIAENDGSLKERRRKFAFTHTWENSVNEIYMAFDRRKSENKSK